MAATLNAKLTLSISNFQKSLNKAERSLRRTGKRMAEVGNQLAVSVSAPLLGVGGAALQAFADIEKFENGLASMMGSAEAAEKELEKLKEVAKAPGLDLTQAVKGSVRLQSVGIAAEQARKVLSETGNAIALVGGTSDDLNGVTLALQQIGAKGKVFAEEINQINERLPQIRAAMKAAFGTANTEDIQAMGISAEQFIQGITVELGKLPRAVGGMSNSFNNARQAVVQSLSTIGESLEKNFNISARIDAFSERLQRLADSFANLSPKAQKAILIVGGLAAAIGPVLIAISSFKLIMASAASGLAVLSGGLSTTITIFSLYGQSLIKLISVSKAQAIATGIQNTAMVLFNNTIKLSNSFLNLFTIQTIKNTAALIAQKATMVAQNVVFHVANNLAAIYLATQSKLSVVLKILTGKIKIVTLAQKALNLVMKASPILMAVAAFSALIAAVTAAYQNIGWFQKFVDKSLNFIRSKFMWLIDGVKFVFNNFPAILKATGAAIKQFVINIANKLKSLVLSAQEFQLKFTRALTINKDKRAELTKAILAITDQKEELSKAGQDLGEVFKAAFKKSLEGSETLGAFNVTNGGGDGDGGGGFTMPEQITAITEQTKAVEEQKSAFIGLANAQTLQSKAFSNTIKPLKDFSKKLKELPEPMQMAETKAQKLATKINQMTDVLKAGFNDLTVSLSQSLGLLVSDLLNLKEQAKEMSEEMGISFGEAKKEVIKSAIGGALKNGFLGPIISVAEQLGKIAIGTGLAVEGIKKALASLNPIIAIAAGAGLLALASFAKSRIGDITPMAKGGIVLPTPGGTIAQIGEAGKAEAVIPLDRLGQMMGNSGGGISKGEFTIKGRDLVYILNLENQAQNRSF